MSVRKCEKNTIKERKNKSNGIEYNDWYCIEILEVWNFDCEEKDVGDLHQLVVCEIRDCCYRAYVHIQPF